MTQDDLLKTFATNGPWAVVAFFLGRKLLAAWDQDRDQLRTIGTQTLALLSKIGDRLDHLAK